MDFSTHSRLTKPERRRAMRLAYWNGGLWSIGNGLVGATLITYLALELGAAGVAVGFILAAPRLIGVLRIFTPRMIAWIGHRQKFCLLMYAASNLVLLVLPIVAAPGWVFERSRGMVALVVAWSLYHLLEYCGTVGLTSWLGDICWQRVRGQFFGQRERWLTLGRIVGMIAAGAFTFWWVENFARELRWQGYAIASAAGALMMLCSLGPLCMMPNLPVRTLVERRKPANSDAMLVAAAASDSSRFWHNLRRLAAPSFLRLLLFGCLFSLVNGMTQTAQGLFPYQVLGLELFALLALEATMRGGQGAFSPWLGKQIDQFGNRPVMIVSQTIVAFGLVFYLLASAAQPWWIVVAWICWIAYAGINIALPALTIKLAGKEDSSLYLGAWFGITGAVYGVSTIAGGMLFDALDKWQFEVSLVGGVWVCDRYHLFFTCGIVGRLLAALSLCWLIEPGASSVREFLKGRRTHLASDPQASDDMPAESS